MQFTKLYLKFYLRCNMLKPHTKKLKILEATDHTIKIDISIIRILKLGKISVLKKLLKCQYFFGILHHIMWLDLQKGPFQIFKFYES